MSKQTNIIEEKVTVDASKALPVLERIKNNVGGVANAFGGMKQAVAGLFAHAGLTGIQASVSGVTQLYERVDRLRAATGLAAGDIHAMTDAFELTGTGSEAAERVITKMALLQQKAAGGSKEAQKLQENLKRIGVKTAGGPVETMESMAAAVEKGKLGLVDMVKTFKIPIAQAGQVMKTLEQGPGRLKAIMDETKNGADVVDGAALASFEKMQQGKRELQDAWDGLVGTVYKQLLPGVTKLVTKLTTGFQQAAPIVERFGTFLTDHMDQVVASAKIYLATMVAAKAIEAASGGKESLGSIGKGLLGGGEGGGPLASLMNRLGLGGKAAGAVGKAVGGGGGKRSEELLEAIQHRLGGGPAAPAAGLAGLGPQFAEIAKNMLMRRATGTILPGGGPAAAAATGLAGRFAPWIAKINTLLPVIRAFGSVLGRIGIIGLVLATAVGVFSKISHILSNDINGHATRLKSLFSDFFAQARGVYGTLKPVIDLIKSVFGTWFTGLAHAILYYVEASMVVINSIMRVITAIGYFVGQLFSHPIETARHMGKALEDAWFKAGPNSNLGDVLMKGKKKDKTDGDKTKTPPPANQDFRGSNFTINQNFADGFDPGRMATVITNDVAATADRRRQSNFAPLFAMRGGA